MAGDRAKRPRVLRGRPSVARRIEALEGKIAGLEKILWSLLETVESQQITIEALSAGHDDLARQGHDRWQDCAGLDQKLCDGLNEHAELINKLRFESLAKDVVITQLVSLISTELGARPEGIHKLCENISTGVLSLSFQHMKPEESERWVAFLSHQTEQLISNVAAQVAGYIAELDRRNAEAEQHDEPEDVPIRLN